MLHRNPLSAASCYPQVTMPPLARLLLPVLASTLTLTAQELRRVAPPVLTVGCHDPIRRKVVLPSSLLYGFEWDGNAMRQTPDGGAPMPACCYVEPGTGRLLAFVEVDPFGTSPQTFVVWQRLGMTWSVLPTTGGPGRSWGAALAHDEVRGELVMFGGFDGTTGLARNDTWTFDGTTWTQRSPATSPGARYFASLACDTVRQRLVLFGGIDGPSGLTDTWEWNGATWAQVVTATSPPPQSAAPMAFDAARNRTLLVTNAGAWTYDGAQWATSSPLPWAPGVAPTGMVYDATRAEMLVTGLREPDASRSELWGWNGTTWTLRNNLGQLPTSVPSAVCATAAGTVQRLVGDYAAIPCQLWEGNGASWNLLAANGPPGRLNAAMWHQGGATFVFGGGDRMTGVVRGDLWRWNGTTWTQLTPAGAGPAARQGAGVVFDPIRQQAVLLGGADQNDVPFGDAWTFDGAVWSQMANTPPNRSFHAMAWDAASQRVVVHGGTGNGTFGPILRNDTWAWDGTAWQQLANAPGAPQGSIAFDTARNKLVLVHLDLFFSTTLYEFTGSAWAALPVTGPLGGPVPWLLSAFAVTGPTGSLTIVDYGTAWGAVELLALPAAAVSLGTACTPTAPRLFAASLPRIGEATFELELTGVANGGLVALAGATAGGNLPLGGCTLLINPGEATVLLAATATGAARFALPIPNQPTLLGEDYFFQAATLDAAAPAGFTLSRGLRLDLGR